MSIGSGCFDIASVQKEMELQQQVNVEMQYSYNSNNSVIANSLRQESISHKGPSFDQSNWGDISFPLQLEDHHFQAPLQTDMFPLHSSSISFTNTSHKSSDTLRDSLPRGYGSGSSNFDSLFYDTSCMTKDIKHFATDRQKRVHLNDKYKALRSLVPNPTKNDRASIIGDTIMYINELKRTVNELKILVDKKMCCRDRIKSGLMNSAEVNIRNEVDQSSLWLQRKSKNTEVDVRIVDDEVTVKLVQQKRTNCLLFVSKVLDDLQLDLHHVAGGLIGDYYSFLFNSKICEGSTVYAIAIANKLIEIVDIQYTENSPCNTTSTPFQDSQRLL